MPAKHRIDPRDLAVSLDQLVEDAFGIMSRCILPCGGLSPHEAIGELMRLLETGSGWEARLAAERLLRPEGAGSSTFRSDPWEPLARP